MAFVVTEPMREVVDELGRPMESVTFVLGRKPVPAIVIVPPRSTRGGVTVTLATLAAPPARPASDSAAAAARSSVPILRMAMF